MQQWQCDHVSDFKVTEKVLELIDKILNEYPTTNLTKWYAFNDKIMAILTKVAQI